MSSLAGRSLTADFQAPTCHIGRHIDVGQSPTGLARKPADVRSLDVQDANVNDANGQASHPSAPDVRPWGHREQVFNHLPGRWLLERSIEGIATMQGHALFAPAEDGR